LALGASNDDFSSRTSHRTRRGTICDQLSFRPGTSRGRASDEAPRPLSRLVARCSSAEGLAATCPLSPYAPSPERPSTRSARGARDGLGWPEVLGVRPFLRFCSFRKPSIQKFIRVPQREAIVAMHSARSPFFLTAEPCMRRVFRRREATLSESYRIGDARDHVARCCNTSALSEDTIDR
jgi:hypothetical protein